MNGSVLDSLVSLRRVARDGSESWVPSLADTVDGRVLIRRIGSDLIECSVSLALMRTLLARGDVIRGARKVWRYTGNELATIAATLLKPLSASERSRTSHVVLKALAIIGEANFTAWVASFGMDRTDVEDLVMTVDQIGAQVERMPVNSERAGALLASMPSNVGGPISNPTLRAAVTAASDLRVRLAALTHSATPASHHAGAGQRVSSAPIGPARSNAV